MNIKLNCSQNIIDICVNFINNTGRYNITSNDITHLTFYSNRIKIVFKADNKSKNNFILYREL